jgi:HEAT repeat protein
MPGQYQFVALIKYGTVYQATAHAVPFLIELLHSESVRDKAAILGLLQCISTGSSFLDVHQTMDHYYDQRQTPEFRSAVAKELEWVHAAHRAVLDAIDTYISCLQSEDAGVRKMAAYVLKTCVELQDRVEGALRKSAREDLDGAVRATAVFALQSLWNRVKRLDGSTESKSGKLARFVLELLNEQNSPPVVRLAAGCVYIDLVGTSAVDELMPIFSVCMELDRDQFRGMPEGELDDPFSQISAALSVDRQSQLNWIRKHLHHSDAEVRKSALLSTQGYCQRWRSGPSGMVLHVADLLMDEDDDVRRIAAWTLGTLGSVLECVQDKLVTAQNDPVELVRDKVEAALERLRNGNPKLNIDRWLRHPERGEETSELVHVLERDDQRDTWERQAIICELARRGELAKSAIPVLRGLLNCNDQWQRVLAARAIWVISHEADAILPLLLSELHCRPCGFLTADCLGEIGPLAMDAIPILERIVNSDDRVPQGGIVDEFVDSDDAFRVICERALTRIRGSSH